MTLNKQDYIAAANNGLRRTDSEFVITPQESVTLETLQARLQTQTRFPALLARIDDRQDELHLSFTQDGETYRYRISLFNSEYDRAMLEYAPGVRNIAPDVRIEAARDRQRIAVVTTFSHDLSLSWQSVIKIMVLLSPDMLVARDMSGGGKLYSRQQMMFEANYPARPRADALYTIHAVHDEESDRYWFHTHGLRRLGLPECEVILLRPVESLGNIGYLIEAFVNICLDDNGMQCLKPRLLARTSEGAQYIVAVPWETGISVVEEGGNLNLLPELEAMEEDLSAAPEGRFPGDLADRQEEHRGPSCLLFRLTDERGSLGCVMDGGLDGDQVMFMKSAALSESHAQKAQMRWPYFQHVFETRGTGPSTFLVKFGVPYGDDDREHMWFILQNIEGENLSGVLINQPYYVSSMQENGVYTLPLTLISDWCIYHDDGQFTPENIFELVTHS